MIHGYVPRKTNGTYLKSEPMADLNRKAWHCKHGVTPETCADCSELGVEQAPSKTAAERKGIPIATGVLDYFPLAIAEVARVSKVANEQHNPGRPMHWNRNKSTDHADCLLRHLIDRGAVDTDGLRHTAKVAWRALALLQTEMERA